MHIRVASLPIRVISRFIPRESPRIATLRFPSSLPSPSHHPLLARPTHQLEKLSSEATGPPAHISNVTLELRRPHS